ncbi:hypothetical protein FQA39_LY15630 [Lamprigera yunnana]|nr:hypothetical protein FQA39_LY15630 [Lamprigera yunnana]
MWKITDKNKNIPLTNEELESILQDEQFYDLFDDENNSNMGFKVVNFLKKNGNSTGVLAVPSDWIFQSASKEYFCWYPKNEKLGPMAAKNKYAVDPNTFSPFRIQIVNENKTYASDSEADANVTCSESETEGTTYRRKKKEKVTHIIRALRVEINALSEMLRAFISRLDSVSGESNENKLGRSIMQEQEKSLNSLSIIEDELRLPCSTYEDFLNLNVKLEDVQVKAAVIRLLRRCTALTPEKTTTAMLQAVFSSNVAVECNWEGRGDKQGIKDFPIVKLMQYKQRKSAREGWRSLMWDHAASLPKTRPFLFPNWGVIR